MKHLEAFVVVAFGLWSAPARAGEPAQSDTMLPESSSETAVEPVDEPAPAPRAPATSKCLDAFQAAQVERDEGRLMEARSSLLVCAREACPTIVRRKCRQWLTTVRSAVPSIVVSAVDPAGVDVREARLFIDGELVCERLDGRAIELDPGEHRLRIEHEGFPPVDAHVVVAQGRRNRLVTLRLPPVPVPEPLPRRAKEVMRSERPAPEETDAISPVAWTGLALGGAGLVLGAVAGGITLARKAELEDECVSAMGCAQSDVDEVTRIAHASTAGFVLAGVGALVGGVALALSLSNRAESVAVRVGSDGSLRVGF